jgi:hypothetical protein
MTENMDVLCLSLTFNFDICNEAEAEYKGGDRAGSVELEQVDLCATDQVGEEAVWKE